MLLLLFAYAGATTPVEPTAPEVELLGGGNYDF